MTTTEKISMSVDPEGIVSIVRQMWAEGRKVKAWRLLKDGFGMPDDVVGDVINGKAKLVDAGNGTVLVEPDSWDPAEEYGSRGGDYPRASVSVLLDELEGWERWRKHRDVLEDSATIVHAALGMDAEVFGRPVSGLKTHASPFGFVHYEYAVRFLASALPPPTREEYNAFWKRHGAKIRDLAAERVEEKRAPRRRMPEPDTPKHEGPVPFFALRDSRDPMQTINIQRRLEEEPLPPPDPEMISASGVILPGGEFYPCVYMGHDSLLPKIFSSLGIDVEDEPGSFRRAAERRGWIFLTWIVSTNTPMVVVYPGQPPPTKGQVVSLLRWCARHDVKYPF